MNEQPNYSLDIEENNKSDLDFASLNYDLVSLEAIDFKEVFRQLLNYLKSLTSDASEQFLPEIRRQLDSEHSWLAKAALISKMPEKLESVEREINSNNPNSAQSIIFSDLKRRLEHLAKSAGDKLLESINQIYTGVHILFDEKLPLNEVREEVSEYLKEQGVKLSPDTTAAQFELMLVRLQSSSVVNSLRSLARQIRPMPIQSELFIKRFLADTKDEIEKEKLSLQFSANKHLAEELMQKLQATLNQAREVLSEVVVMRLSKKISTLAVAKIIQNYSVAEKEALYNQQTKLSQPSSAATPTPNIASESAEIANASHTSIPEFNPEPLEPSTDSFAPDITPSEQKSPIDLEAQADHLRRQQELAREREAQELEYRRAQELQRAKEESEALEATILQAEELVKKNQTNLEIYEAQLICADKIVSCYQNFNLEPVANMVSSKIQDDLSELNYNLAQMDKTVHWTSLGLSDEQATNMQVMQKEARTDIVNCIDKTNQFLQLQTLNIDSNTDNTSLQSDVVWQIELREMLANDGLDQLKKHMTKLVQISAIKNKYLRIILIIRYSRLNAKLSEAIIRNMASWSDRFVEKAVVINTLSYLGVQLGDKHLAKICPSNKLKTQKHKQNSALYALYEECVFWLINQYESLTGWFQSSKGKVNSK